MPPDPPSADDAAWRAARRRAARAHHPDRGGDAQAYLAALAEVDERFGRGTAPGPRRRQDVDVSRGDAGDVDPRSARRLLLRAALRTSFRASRGIRARLQRGLPGSPR